MAVEKRAFYKVYDRTGTLLTTWNDDVASIPQYRWSINGSMGELIIKLARPINNFGETEDVAMFNKVDTYIQDGDSPNGVRIHSGSISGYNVQVEESGRQLITVHVLSNTSEIDKDVLEDGSGNTTIVYTSNDPSDIIKNILNLAGRTITYNSDSIENTGTTVSYTFKYASVLDAIKKTLELCPAYWYWYVDAQNLLQLHSSNFDIVDHKLFVGRELKSIDVFKTVEKMYNRVFFLGGGNPNLYKLYTSSSSVTEYGQLDYFMSDTRVENSTTAATMANKFLEENDHFEQQLKCTVIDNNGSDGQFGGIKGYDIESLRPGDIVTINEPGVSTIETLWYDDSGTLGNFIWSVSFWDFDIQYSLGIPMQIQEINYQFHKAELILSTRLPEVTKRIEDIDRNLIVQQSENIPTIPS